MNFAAFTVIADLFLVIILQSSNVKDVMLNMQAAAAPVKLGHRIFHQ